MRSEEGEGRRVEDYWARILRLVVGGAAVTSGLVSLDAGLGVDYPLRLL